MSVNIAPRDMSTAVIGTTGIIDWTNKAALLPIVSAGSEPEMAHALLFNENGCGLDIQFAGGKQDRVPAGGWRVWELTAADTSFKYTVTYVLPNQPVSLLLVTIYNAGEKVSPLPILGNSPIGVSGIVTTSPNFIQIPLNSALWPQLVINIGPDAATNTDWQFIVDASGNLELIDGQHAANIWTAHRIPNSFEIFTTLNLHGAIDHIGGQPTVGTVGVPGIQSLTQSVPVTVTGSNTILTFLPAVDGFYRVSGYVRVNNSVSGQNITFLVFWTELDTLFATSEPFTVNNVIFNGLNSVGNGAYGMYVFAILCRAAGNDIHIVYNDPGGVPNDRVTVTIERLF